MENCLYMYNSDIPFHCKCASRMHSRDKVSISANKKQPFAKHYDDILFLILEKLDWIDRFRARTVCKLWFQQIAKVPYQGDFPWLFRYKIKDGAGCQVKLTDESSKRSYVTESREQLFGASICASRNGWILMMREQEENQEPPTGDNILFECFIYCPFTGKLIDLPTLNSQTYTPTHYNISSNPTLTDCVFFALYPFSQTIEISTCRIGDKEWKKYEIKLSISYDRFSFECINELLYVVMLRSNPPDVYSEPILNSHVGTFDAQTQEWKLIKNETGFMNSNIKKAKPPVREQYLYPVVYNNKELYLVRRKICNVGWDLFKYGMEEKQWVEQTSLGNRVLFLDYHGSFLVDAVGKLSDVANNAFYGFRASQSYYYPFSFSSRKIQRHHKFYVDNITFEDSKLYQSAWHSKLYQSAWVIPAV